MNTTKQALNEDAYAAYQSALSAAKAVQPQAQEDACEVLATVLHFIPASETDLLRDVSALCHDLRTYGNPQASEPAWMPIETAPKDETQPFLAWVPMDDFVDGVIVQVSMFEGRMYHDAKGASIDWDDAVENATHWMPLPAAPEATK